ncbi:hypothetical protein [Ferruginibacter sp. SUN106]|uniref:hypothetical protein n=1 Tax=Ferruginibacter sp. SUN106 TaxID=2978348 RepID=UPI003D368B55
MPEEIPITGSTPVPETTELPKVKDEKAALELEKLKYEVREVKIISPIKNIILLIAAIMPSVYLLFNAELANLKREITKAQDEKKEYLAKLLDAKSHFEVKMADDSIRLSEINTRYEIAKGDIRKILEQLTKTRADSAEIANGIFKALGDLKTRNAAYASLLEINLKLRKSQADTLAHYKSELTDQKFMYQSQIVELRHDKMTLSTYYTDVKHDLEVCQGKLNK